MESNVRPSNRSGVWTVWPAARSSSANAWMPGVRPWAWWNSRTSAIDTSSGVDRDAQGTARMPDPAKRRPVIAAVGLPADRHAAARTPVDIQVQVDQLLV